jgi:GAF domain-containing protein
MNTQATSEWSTEIQHRRAMLLDRLLLIAVVFGLVAMVLFYVALLKTTNAWGRVTTMTPFVVGWLVVLIVWAWRSIGHQARALALLSIVHILSTIVLVWGGLPGSGRVWLLLPPALAFVLLGPRPVIASGAVSVLTYVLCSLAISQKWVVPQVAENLNGPISLGIEGGSFLLVAAILTSILWSFNRSWSKALAGASAANSRLQAQAQKLAETNKQLHRQTSQLQATADIAHAGSSILDPDTLMAQLVNRIQEGFSQAGVYYVGLFLLNEAQRVAVLRAATGEAGRLLLEMGYQVALDETCTISRCITHRQARVAQDAGEGTLRIDKLPMPHTRSEVALPLRSRGRLLGALSMASTQEEAFGEADIAVLQTMADQVAVAIDNAVLYSQTRTTLEHLQAVQQRYVHQAWREFLTTTPVVTADYTQPGTKPGDQKFLREARRAVMVHKRTVATSSPPPGDDENDVALQAALVVPLKLRGQVIGTVALHETAQQRPWTAEEIALAESVAEQVALTAENLRLMDETQRRAAREQLVSRIAGQVWASLDPDTILRTTVRELGRALGAERATVEITGPGRDGDGAYGEEFAHGGEE